MGGQTGIAWTERTWNPWRGCTKVSSGCDHCYMFREQRRYGSDPEVVTRTKTWGDPTKWNRQAEAVGVMSEVFTCSWSDWFHRDADAWRDEAWAIVRACRMLRFQILTKRAERMARCLPPDWGAGYENVVLGVSIEGPDQGWRLQYLKAVRARWKFVSAEPLIADISSLDFAGIDQVIFGGESAGPGETPRPCNVAWIRNGISSAHAAGASAFVKQLGALPVGVGLLQSKKGDDPSEWPADLRVQERPWAPPGREEAK